MDIAWDKVNAVILDLGGVILNIDYQRTIDAFQALGFLNFDKEYSQLQQSGLFDLLETGKITETTFVEAIQQKLPLTSAPQIINAWNALLLDFPPGRIATVRTIANSIPTYLLSNTNEIHLKAFNSTLQEQTGLSDIKPLFKKAYLSHEIHLRKPDPLAFWLILREQHLHPEEVLFVDDSIQHVLAAQSIGIQAFHLQLPMSLESVFSPFLA